ncbi:MAG: dTDP-4-dehydrorhamnose reductase [Desulfobacteraceae bacterium 4572_35.1]|nr:MAG: dTDP-4-dehydrorhamnose reductase [Desulfobacteraceae bacterium 4572_35.1]
MSYARIAIIGANGMLASMLRATVSETVALHLYDLPEFDITNATQVDTVLGDLQPDVIINCAAFTQVDNCETQQELAFAVNGQGPANLAAVAKKIGAVLVHISTDFVFSGDATTPYNEEAVTNPLSVYGASKRQGEQAIINSGLAEYYIVRTSWLYGPNGANFVETIIRLATEREELGIVADQTGTPTYTVDLSNAIWCLLDHSASLVQGSEFGIYHYSNDGACTWYDFACEIISQLRQANVALKVKKIKPITTDEYPVPAKRPAYSVMSKEKIVTATGLNLPPWQESLTRYLKGRLKN